jgi:hypothetical protein
MNTKSRSAGVGLVVVAIGLALVAPSAWAATAPKLTGRLATNAEPDAAAQPFRLDLDGGAGSMLLRGEPLSQFKPGSRLLVQGLIKTELVLPKQTGGMALGTNDHPRWRIFMDVLKAHEIQSPFALNDAQGPVLAWQQATPYRAPDFLAYFPDDLDGAQRLDAWWNSRGPEANRVTDSDEEIMDLLRHGLRRSRVNALPVLRWFGNRYIWGQPAQNPEAIELMYHAADPRQDKRPEARYWAVYFGLSVVQPKTPAILRALAEIAMTVDDPNDLNRIAWGVKSQQKEFLAHLDPFLSSSETRIQDKARIVQRIVREELNAFEWATEIARQRAQAKFADQLPAFRQRLAEGSSQERQAALDEISRERIYLIMDESFLDAFEACAKDNDEKVRYAMVRIVGEHWIWEAKQQSSKAIDQMLRLTHDPSARVRYYAVYSGLSTVRQKSDPLVRRLVEMLVKGRDRDLAQRIVWGLRADREAATRILEDYAKDPDPDTAKAAREATQAFR